MTTVCWGRGMSDILDKENAVTWLGLIFNIEVMQSNVEAKPPLDEAYKMGHG